MSIDKIHYFDVGARGDLGKPWRDHYQDLKIFGFEADPLEHERLSASYPDRQYFPVGLYSCVGNIDLYLTRNPYQSSTYPPNLSNSQFEPRHWSTRQVEKNIGPCINS